MTVYAIDFDGTIVTEEYPAIGKPIQATIEFIRAIQKRGDKWILLTMREGKSLREALTFLVLRKCFPAAINDNLPERVEQWGNNPRKVYADVYIDDHNAGGLAIPDLKKTRRWKMTNAERIRAMSDEELLEWLEGLSCAGMDDALERCKGYETCRECWMAWLAEDADGADGVDKKQGNGR